MTSNCATLKTIAEPTITKQPVDASGIVGSTVQFTVEATGEKLRYQWQCSKDDGETYADLTSWAGYKTNSLRVPVKGTRNGYKLRCVITDKYGQIVTSNAATLIVKNGGVVTGGAMNFFYAE